MPNGWTTTTLGELADLVVGRTPPRKEDRYWTDDLKRPFCTIADMDGMDIVPQREGVTDAAESEGKAKRVPAGSLLMSFKLTIGRVATLAIPAVHNEAIVWIKPREGVPVVDRYLALWLSHLDLTESAGRAVKGQTLNGPSLRAIPVELPPLVVQRRVVDLVDAVDVCSARAGQLAVAAMSARAALRAAVFADASVAATALRDLCSAGGIQIGPFGSQLHASDYVDEGGIPTVMPKDMVDGSISVTSIARVGEDDWA
ncbi:MAG: restriction endonuclease subunit S, partial [Acidimicrobiales bacterium]|nr:restriction endonuclease subunit S [Acidimicrobiales bacterium]